MEELIRTSTTGPHRGLHRRSRSRASADSSTPPKEYFQIVEKIVRNHGGIFISDEVQTGWGRTGGKWFGIEQWGVMPDIITSAKGLGNGSPIGRDGGAAGGGRRGPGRSPFRRSAATR